MKKIISYGVATFFSFIAMASVAFAQVTFNATWATTMGLSTRGLSDTLITVVNAVLALLGLIAIIIILIGGFKWMTSGGNEEKVASARQMIIAGIIGLAIILSAFAIVKFVVTNVAS